MNKSSIVYFFILIALFVGALNYSSTVQKPFISSLNFIKTSYHNTISYIDNSIDRHFFQADTIDELKEQLQQYENNHLVMQELASEIDDLYKANDFNMSVNPQVQLVRSISYQKLGNLNRLWLDVEDYNSSKIYGLTYKEMVAGIVIEHDSKPLALLNNDIKSAYSVYIGDVKAPGIAHGNNDEYIVVNFIPAWFIINEGDEVVTSGLDNIFFKGLKVGKVISINQSEGYQTAIIDPYYDPNEPNYFYMIKVVK
ncbi:rod shape-determining protein MreC [Sulfurimonas marina]|uniref:Rod shape-determining protein MreC n=1 Tax=Sulfurimonas marina TaxID=2590551 RepID=A0A7M1ATX2_9BACT|nr:rod shape-determining protein MreC [Sulfurimonas marina]QOP40883.1 rod shape-determining protein MreC [Sulfurimonas marina]